MSNEKKYVPPGSRKAQTKQKSGLNMFTSSKDIYEKFGEEKQYSVRVLNINSITEESELKNLFYNMENFPKIKHLVTSTIHRGFIFMKFYSEEDMMRAIPMIQNQRLNQMILDAEVAKPREKKERPQQSLQGLEKDRHKKTGMIYNHPPCLFRTSCTWCVLRDSIYNN